MGIIGTICLSVVITHILMFVVNKSENEKIKFPMLYEGGKETTLIFLVFEIIVVTLIALLVR